MKLQGDLVLSLVGIRDILQWNLERLFTIDFEREIAR